MAVKANAGARFDATVQGYPAAMGGTIGITIYAGDGTTIVSARQTSGMREHTILGLTLYTASLQAPSTPGRYLLAWDMGTPVNAAWVAPEELFVSIEDA